MRLARVASWRGATTAVTIVVVVLSGLWDEAEIAHASTFTVDSTGDGSDILLADGVCADIDGACTLRAAIEQANVTPGIDTIAFSIGSGAQAITPGSALPTVIQPVVIDATSQPGWAGSPVIELVGTGAGSANGLTLTGGGSAIRGLVIRNWSGFGIVLNTLGGNTIAGNYIGVDATGAVAQGNGLIGIHVDGSPGNTIGGMTAGDRNVVSGNAGTGIVVDDATGNIIWGNFVGTDASGTFAIPNSNAGVTIGGPGGGNTVGGADPSARNVISGNGSYGVYVVGTLSDGNLVQGNYIGTNASGSAAIANDVGVFLHIDGDETTGANVIRNNLISGNTDRGILVNQVDQIIEGNRVGVQADGVSPLGNGGEGIYVNLRSGVGGTGAGQANTIGFNGGAGIWLPIASETGATFRGNSIYSNGQLAIDLGGSPGGVTLNDAGDGDAGANDLQNFPVLTSVSEGAGMTQIAGTLNSTPNATFTLDFYANSACDPSGYGEGETYIGSASVTTDGGGNAGFSETFTFALAGRAVTATATNPGGSTSEFSLCFGQDSDGDGCSNSEETGPDPNLGGARDPGSPWDFFDVPTPALTMGNPSGMRNKAVSLTDVGAVLFYVGTTYGGGTNPNGVDYDTDYNANTTDDGREYDRTPSTVTGEPWHSGPPNGAVSLSDVGVALAQVGDNCAAPP
jgi:hypothetical protein